MTSSNLAERQQSGVDSEPNLFRIDPPPRADESAEMIQDSAVWCGHSGIVRFPLAPQRERGYGRRLSAVLYADVAGYSRLTEEDEEGTHRRISAYLDLIGEAVEAQGGGIAHFAGDAVLAQFDAVSSALRCAVGVQAEMAERERSHSPARQIRFRIGIHVGDVVIDRYDVFGNVVNVAARLQSLARPGEICISEAVLLAGGSQYPLRFVSMGRR